MAQPLFIDVDTPDNVKFLPIKRLNNGGMRVELKYQKDRGEQEIFYQTARFRRGYVKAFEDEKTGKKLKLECLLLGYDNPYTETHKFTEGWKALEARVVQTAKEKCADWFKKALKDSEIDAYWNSSIRAPSDPAKYSPSLKIAIPLGKDGQPDVTVYNDREEKTTWADFEENIRDAEFQCIVKVSSLYFMPKAFGLVVQLQSIQFFPTQKMAGFAFRKRDRDGEDPDTQQPTKRMNGDDTDVQTGEYSPTAAAAAEAFM